MPEKTILTVHSPGDERSEWETALAAAGWDVVCCDSAAAAITELSRGEPAVMLAEIDLRPAGALELLKLLKSRWPAVRVVCTAHERRIGDILECLRGGAADYIHRPFEAARLVRAVEDARRETAADEALDIDVGEEGWIQLRMPSSELSMRRLDKFFRRLHEPDVSPDTLEEISLCFVEIVRNAIEWGNRGDASRGVLVSHMLFQDEIVFKVEDTGEGFGVERALGDVEDVAALEAGRQAAGQRPGGLGIAMVTGMMDSVIYNDAGNMLVMSKKLYDDMD